MITDELKKEAEKWLCNNLHSANEEDFIKAMVDIAESREKRIAELEKELNYAKTHCLFHSDCPVQKENADLKEEVNKIAFARGSLEEEKTELKKQLTELKEFYEIEYFQISDRTADEKIKELEKHQVEVTIDDYSPYDENTWGMMHEEWFVPKEEVRDLLKENYALITKAKEIIKEFMKYEINEYDGSLEIHFEELKKQAEQFLKSSEVEK